MRALTELVLVFFFVELAVGSDDVIVVGFTVVDEDLLLLFVDTDDFFDGIEDEGVGVVVDCDDFVLVLL